MYFKIITKFEEEPSAELIYDNGNIQKTIFNIHGNIIKDIDNEEQLKSFLFTKAFHFNSKRFHDMREYCILGEKITLAQIIEELKINKGVKPYSYDTFEVEEFIDETNS